MDRPYLFPISFSQATNLHDAVYQCHLNIEIIYVAYCVN